MKPTSRPDPEHESDLPEPAPESPGSPWRFSILEAVSLLYLVSPFAIFVLGWLRPAAGVPLFVLLCAASVAAYLVVARPSMQPVSDAQWLPRGNRLAGMIVLVFAVVACTGIGGLTYQFFDYAFYDAVLKDLMTYSWPLAYEEAGPDKEPLHLVIYAAYWIPAAMVGRTAGWFAAYMFHYLWAVGAVFLILCWFLRLARSRSLALVAMLLFFGGLDIVGRLLTESLGASNVSLFGYLAGEFWWSNGYGWLDHWSSSYALTDPDFSEKANGVFFRFFSPFSFLVDGPHHLLPGLIGFMMLLDDWWRKQSLSRSLLLWACLPFCSVFMAAGSFPFLALAIVEKRGKGLLSFPNAAAVPFIAMMVLFYATVQGVEGGRVSGWLWEFQDLRETWRYLALHYLVEFGIYALLIPALRIGNLLPNRLWWFGALTMFLLAPFYRMGEYNDFTTKVIIPAQFVFLVYLAIALLNAEGKSQLYRRNALIGLLCIGALGPLGNVVRAVEFGFAAEPPPFERVRHINEVEPRVLALQGKGNPDSIFFKWLAGEAHLQPTEPIETSVSWDFTLDGTWDPDDYIIYVDADHFEVTPQGLRFLTQANQPILRRDVAALDTSTIGKVRLKMEVYLNGEAVDDYRVVFQWATLEQVLATGDDWPFPPWQNNQAWPILRVVSTNSYWRGRAEDVVFSLLVPDSGEELYEVILSEIAYLER